MSDRATQAAAWIYSGLWSILVRRFKVPDRPPDLPKEHEDEIVHRFGPALGFLTYLRLWFWIIALVIDLVLLGGFIALSVALFVEGLWWLAVALIPPVLFIMIVPDIIAYVAIHLRFDTTRYVMNDRSLRIRRGVWNIQETTITFENVQNIRISKGPVQQLLGIANLVVETAGSGGGEHSHQGSANQGVIEGIADAVQLRDRILPHLRRSTKTGLGDEDDEPSSATPQWSPQHLAVLREIREALAGI